MTTEETLRSAQAMKAAGQLQDAERVIERALDSAASGVAERVRLLRELADLCAKQGHWHRAQSVIDEAFELLGDDAERDAFDLWAALTERRAWIFFRQGRIRDAAQIAQYLCRVLDEETQAALLADVYNTIGGVAYQEARHLDGITAVTKSAALYEQVDNIVGLATARMNLGVLLLTEGRWREAVEEFAASDQLREQLDDRTGRSSTLVNLGLLKLALGDYDEARHSFDESLRMSAEAGEEYIAAHAQLALGYLSLLESRIDEADEHLEAALARDERMCGDDRVQAAWVKALVECERGNLDRAMKLAGDARRVAHESSLLDCEADCCRALGIAHLRSKQYDEAKRLLFESASLAQQASDPYRRALALLELGNLCHEASCSDAEAAERWADEGRLSVREASDVFMQLGAKRDLARADMMRSSFEVR